jgi:LmbE family N-acetylglucosaminyl deacetylase
VRLGPGAFYGTRIAAALSSVHKPSHVVRRERQILWRGRYILTVSFAALAFSVGHGPVRAASGQLHAPHHEQPTLSIDSETRLLVIAPHPDDEVLGAGGLIQRVHAAGGVDHIVYLTDGEGFPAGVRAEEHRTVLTAADYRGYGRRRQHEARAALHVLGVEPDALTFLGFPNNGLGRLMTRYWSERRAAYRSPFTRFMRPLKSEIIEPDTEFRGEDLTQELARIIGEFRPTMMVVPRKEDQHVDHCGAWFFAADALGDIERVRPDFQVDLLTYIVHFNAWPFEDDSPRLVPPADLSGGASGWVSVPLSPSQLVAKRLALRQYRSQQVVMDWFLDGFLRRNEVFARPAQPHVLLPIRRSPCDEFVESSLTP